MKKRILSGILAAGLMLGINAYAGETRTYGDYNGGVYPVEISNVKWDSIQDVPTDLGELKNMFNLDSESANPESENRDYRVFWAYEIGKDHIPTFIRAEYANGDGENQNVYIETDGPAHIKFLKNGVNYIEKYPPFCGEAAFAKQDENTVNNEHPEEFVYNGYYNEINMSDVPVYGMWYKKWDYDENDDVILSDEAYNWDQALAETNRLKKEDYEKNIRFYDKDYVYKDETSPDFRYFVGMAGGDVTLEENGIYEIISADWNFLGGQGFAYEIPHSYIVKVTGAREPAPAADSSIAVNVNGAPVSFVFDDFGGGTSEIKPIIQDGRTLVPVRAVAEAFGAVVNWDGGSRTASFEYKGMTVSMQIDKNEIDKNGTKITLDVPAQIINDRTFVPLRAVAEAFGAKVSWDEETRTADINV